MAWAAYLESLPWEGRDKLRIARLGNGVRNVVGPLTMTAVQSGLVDPDGLVAMDDRPEEIRDFLQAMMDCAYEAGLRPSRAQDERHLKAHLEDIRRIAFHGMGIREGG